MELRTEVWKLREAVYGIVCNVVVLQGSNADAVEADTTCELYGVHERAADVETVAGQVDSHQDDFTEARRADALELRLNTFHGAGAGAAAAAAAAERAVGMMQ